MVNIEKKNTPYSHVLTIAICFEIIFSICLRIPPLSWLYLYVSNRYFPAWSLVFV